MGIVYSVAKFLRKHSLHFTVKIERMSRDNRIRYAIIKDGLAPYLTPNKNVSRYGKGAA